MLTPALLFFHQLFRIQRTTKTLLREDFAEALVTRLQLLLKIQFFFMRYKRNMKHQKSTFFS